MNTNATQQPVPLIQLRGITKAYGEGATAFLALKGVDLAIGRGEFVAIMGPSGSGKSTAMNLLGCLDRPTGGQYLFMGAHVEALSRDERARLRRRYFGFVFQGFNLLARTSAQENVELPLLYRGEPAARRLKPILRNRLAQGLVEFAETRGDFRIHVRRRAVPILRRERLEPEPDHVVGQDGRHGAPLRAAPSAASTMALASGEAQSAGPTSRPIS